jgi:hypothetical protein
MSKDDRRIKMDKYELNEETIFYVIAVVTAILVTLKLIMG